MLVYNVPHLSSPLLYVPSPPQEVRQLGVCGRAGVATSLLLSTRVVHVMRCSALAQQYTYMDHIEDCEFSQFHFYVFSLLQGINLGS